MGNEKAGLVVDKRSMMPVLLHSLSKEKKYLLLIHVCKKFEQSSDQIHFSPLLVFFLPHY